MLPLPSMNYLDVKFPYYPNNIKITKPLGTVSMRDFIRAVSNPHDKVKQLFEDIKKASAARDLKKKAALKSGLYYFTPCINTDGLGRSYSNISSFTGFMQIDFDGLTDPEGFRDWFFENVKSSVVVGVSSSGFGVKAILRIPKVCSVDEFKEYFYGVSYYLEDFIGFDMAPQNCSLPLYLFYDPDTKWRENATVSTVRGEKINAFDPNREIDFEVPENVDLVIEEKVVKQIEFLINRIQDNAHPQLLGISFLVGGWAGANYIGEELAFDTLNTAIENNEYMNKDTNGYLRTAKQMFFKGIDSPAEFKN